MKKIIRAATTGITIGTLISLGFSLASGSEYLPSTSEFVDHFPNSSLAMLTSVIAWALIGVMGLGIGKVFSIPQWSLLKRTIVNYLLIYTILTTVSLLFNWINLTLLEVSIYTIIFTAIYILNWFILYHHTKTTINKINNKLNSKKNPSSTVK